MNTPNKRRDLPREETTFAAIMRHGDTQQLCIVENISPRGACLKINPELTPLQAFDLLLQDQDPIAVKIAWRSGGRIGVRREVNDEAQPWFRRLWPWNLR